MIKLLRFLFIFTSLYSQESIFTFPDHHSRFIYEINQSFKNSTSILILTPLYRHTALSKGILSAAKHGCKVNLIITDPHSEPLSLIQYQNIHLYLAPVSVHQSVILVDNTLICTSNESIDEDIFSSYRSSFRCSDSPIKIDAIRHSIRPILERSKTYLE